MIHALVIGFFLNIDTGETFTLSRPWTKGYGVPEKIAEFICIQAGMDPSRLDTMLLVKDDQVMAMYHGDTMPKGFGE